MIPESFAIYRFLARRLGFYGKDDLENALIDATADVLKDAWIKAKPFYLAKGGFIEGDTYKLGVELYGPAMEEAFMYIKKVIDESKSGFVAPSGLTWVDFWIAEYVVMNREIDHDFAAWWFWTGEYVNRVHGDPRIKDYVRARRGVRPSYANSIVDRYY